MTRVPTAKKPVRLVRSDRPLEVFSALTEALSDDGPAVFPVAPGHDISLTSVDQDVAVIVQTSGSTSRPKQVWFTSQALLSSADMVNKALGGGTWFLALPTHYIAGLQVLTRSLQAHTLPIVAGPGTLAKELVASLEALSAAKTKGPLFVSLVPAQLRQVLQAAQSNEHVHHALSLFDRILLGGQRVPRDVLDDATQWGLSVTKTYGSAETSGGCVWDGKPLDQVEVDIVDGRVAIAGPMLAGGYLNDEERTAAAFVERSGTRWFITDDRGDTVDHTLRVLGRVDQVMISGGLKVDLAEVEEFLSGLFGTSEVVALSRADDTWGEVPVVVSPATFDREQVVPRLVDQFGKAMRQVEFLTLDPLPRTATGKIDRGALRQMLPAPSDYPGQL